MAPVVFGALLFNYQAIDIVGPFDILNSSSKPILQFVDSQMGLDKTLIDRAPEFVFHHIGETLEPVTLLTSNYIVKPTTTVDDCPELDALLIGGTIPEGFSFPQSYVDFIKRHHKAGKLIFTTCTGAAALATTGVLDGKNATVNNVEYDWIAKEFPKVKWTKAKKWIIDGNIWTGSGASAGIDMFAHWIKENYGLDVLKAGALNLDYEPRDVDGLYTVFPQRFDKSGKQISTSIF